jgi:GNAT superfamily N-acetyltransferase
MRESSVLEIEEAAFRAWPAEEVVELSGWRLRFTRGITRRANSVWPNEWRGETPLAERVEAVEAFAASRGIAPSFQLTAAAKPAELDGWLADRGYVIDAPVVVMTQNLEGFAEGNESLELETTVLSYPSADWLFVAIERGRFAGARAPFSGILARIGARGAFALSRTNEGPVAVGLGVVDGELLGIFNMMTVPEARRRGAARSILRALAAWGSEHGAAVGYLQVERDNAPARALYASSGFSPAYEYHYRTKLPPPQRTARAGH